MALSDLQLPTHLVKFSGGEFAVRGLSLDDLVPLVQGHGATLQALIGAAQAGGVTIESAADLGKALVEQAPLVAAEIIALGSDSPGQAHLARRLPVSVQLEALEAIGRFTFDVEGGPKKVAETVVRIAQGVLGLVQSPDPT